MRRDHDRIRGSSRRSTMSTTCSRVTSVARANSAVEHIDRKPDDKGDDHVTFGVAPAGCPADGTLHMAESFGCGLAPDVGGQLAFRVRDDADGLAPLPHCLQDGDGVGAKASGVGGRAVEMHDAPVDRRGEQLGAVWPATVQRRLVGPGPSRDAAHRGLVVARRGDLFPGGVQDGARQRRAAPAGLRGGQWAGACRWWCRRGQGVRSHPNRVPCVPYQDSDIFH